MRKSHKKILSNQETLYSDKSLQKQNVYTSTKKEKASTSKLIEKKIEKNYLFGNTNTTVDNYLNRRHLQELERIRKYKEDREKRERNEYSFKPKISKKSKRIINNIIERESVQPSNYVLNSIDDSSRLSFVEASSTSQIQSQKLNISHSTKTYNKQLPMPPSQYQQFDYGEQNKLITIVSDYLNSNTKVNSKVFMLDFESRKFAKERLRAISNILNNQIN